MGSTFKRSTPEAQGIPSAGIIQMLDMFEKYAIPMHSLLLMRHGHLICDAYWAPYTKHTLQRMYSITKSFVSLAIGVLATKGKLSLDDHIVDFFPDKLPHPVPPQLRKTTIRHMLTMATCHRMTTYKMTNDPDWTRTFFTVPPDHEPGSFFMYDTSSSHVLGSLVERVTGQKVLDYLRDTLFSGIPFSNDAYIIQDPCQVSMGGSGLMATSEDILQVIQSIPADDNPYRQYLDEACSKQIETAASGFGNMKNLEEGYGYSIWRFDSDSFGFYGVGGQLAIAMPKYDLFFVTTAYTKGIEGGLQNIMDALWSILPSLASNPIPESTDANLLQQKVDSLSLPVLRGKYTIPSSAYSWEGTYKLKDNTFGLLAMSLELKDKACTVSLEYADCSRTIVAGFGINTMQNWAFDPSLSVVACGAFNNDGNLTISIHFLWPELGITQIMIAGNGSNISMLIKETMEKEITRISGVFSGEKQES